MSKFQTPKPKVELGRCRGAGQAVVSELADWAGKVQHRLFQAGAALPESPA